MRVLAEVSWEKEDGLGEGESSMIREMYFLLHWGMNYTIVNGIAVNYTVAICQDCKTGDIRCFLPEQLRVVGKDISNLKK